MEKKPHDRSFGKRDLSKVKPEEMLLAARYWACNTVIMSVVDPWRSHLASMVFAAVLAPDAGDLESWLRHAHTAVRGASLQTSCYQQGRYELLSWAPPWFRESERIVPGMPTQAIHDQRWSRELRLEEMGRLLDEIKADGQLKVAPGGSLIIA